ncbi:hypothetical protein KEM48_004561 [Puccinia striiformis f. sp. tritici PST-130]|nr:hypothetical protein KEM48_004561 [Puccinia striiformis f. sp. tritici PST-130]
MWSKPTANSSPLKLQQPGIKQTEQDKQRAEEVKTAFTGAFDDYMKYGFPGDKGLSRGKLYSLIHGTHPAD